MIKATKGISKLRMTPTLIMKTNSREVQYIKKKSSQSGMTWKQLMKIMKKTKGLHIGSKYKVKIHIQQRGRQKTQTQFHK